MPATPLHPQASAELRYKSALLKAQHEASLDGVLIVDEEGRIASYNRRFAELWAIPKDVLALRSDDRALKFVLDQLADPQAFLERVKFLYKHRRQTSLDELALADGRTFERYSAPIFGSRGRYYGRVWYFRDVTERRQAADDRRTSEARYRELFEAHSDAVLVFDLHTRAIEDVNLAALRKFGYPKRTLLGMAVERLCSDPKASVAEFVTLVSANDRTPLIEAELRRKDGSTFPAEMRTGRFLDGGRAKIIGAVRDVTERRRAAQAEAFRERELLQRRFVATVSHELRTPITAIKGFAETLLEGGLDDPRSRAGFVETILRHADRLGALVDDLLTLSVIESGKRRLRLEPLDAARFVAEFIRGMAPVARRKKVSLAGEVSPGLVIQADRVQLTQVLQNLTDNALKYSPRGGKVRIKAVSADEQALFRVVDQGLGIPAAELGRVFERFHRMDVHKSVPGSGLGLAIVKNIVEAHEGRVWAESDPGRGSSFHFTLPLAGYEKPLNPT